MIAGVVVTHIISTSSYSLEVVAMEMEGVLSSVVVVQHNLDDLVLFEDEGVGVASVDDHVGCGLVGGKG